MKRGGENWVWFSLFSSKLFWGFWGSRFPSGMKREGENWARFYCFHQNCSGVFGDLGFPQEWKGKERIGFDFLVFSESWLLGFICQGKKGENREAVQLSFHWFSRCFWVLKKGKREGQIIFPRIFKVSGFWEGFNASLSFPELSRFLGLEKDSMHLSLFLNFSRFLCFEKDSLPPSFLKGIIGIFGCLEMLQEKWLRLE